MKTKGKMYFSAFWVLLGVTLFALSVAGVADSFWSGMGGGMIGVGIAQLIRFRRAEKDQQYREEQEIKASDERNLFIQCKAWQWAVTLYIIISGVAVVVLKILGQEQLSMAASFSICGLVLLYWVCWLVLQKKY